MQINRGPYCESRFSNGSRIRLIGFYWLTVVEDNSYLPVWTSLLDMLYKGAYGMAPGAQIAIREKTWKKIPVILCDHSCLSSLLPNSSGTSMQPQTDFARKAWMPRPTKTLSLGCCS